MMMPTFDKKEIDDPGPILLHTKEELVTMFKASVYTIKFKKTDGSEREMLCTLVGDFLPKRDIASLNADEINARKENPGTVAVWDLTNKGWRSFRVENLLSISEENNVEGRMDDPVQNSATSVG